MEQIQEKQKVEDILKKYAHESRLVPVTSITANPWNPNEESPATFESLKRSIKKYGWLQYPLVRHCAGYYQIIDGEHRVKAAKELGIDAVLCFVLGTAENEVDDADAMLLTQLLNTRGQDDVLKRAALLKRIKDSGQPDLFGMLAMTQKEVDDQLALLDFDFSQFANPDKEDIEQTRAEKALECADKLEHELKKVHAETKNVNVKLLVEQFYEWKKVFTQHYP